MFSFISQWIRMMNSITRHDKLANFSEVFLSEKLNILFFSGTQGLVITRLTNSPVKFKLRSSSVRDS